VAGARWNRPPADAGQCRAQPAAIRTRAGLATGQAGTARAHPSYSGFPAGGTGICGRALACRSWHRPIVLRSRTHRRGCASRPNRAQRLGVTAAWCQRAGLGGDSPWRGREPAGAFRRRRVHRADRRTGCGWPRVRGDRGSLLGRHCADVSDGIRRPDELRHGPDRHRLSQLYRVALPGGVLGRVDRPGHGGRRIVPLVAGIGTAAVESSATGCRRPEAPRRYRSRQRK